MKLFFVYGNIGLAYRKNALRVLLGRAVPSRRLRPVPARVHRRRALYKPLSLSMWTSLMATVQFAFWFRHSEKQGGGRKENGNYAGVYPGESPLDDCKATWFAAFLVMLPYLAWGVVAFVIFIPLVIIFFPLPLIVIGPGARRRHVHTDLFARQREGARRRSRHDRADRRARRALHHDAAVHSVRWPLQQSRTSGRASRRCATSWEKTCAARLKKIFSSQQQTEAHATLMLKVFAVQVRKRTRARATESDRARL